MDVGNHVVPYEPVESRPDAISMQSMSNASTTRSITSCNPSALSAMRTVSSAYLK